MPAWSNDENDPEYLRWKEAAESAQTELGDAYTEKERTESELVAARQIAQAALSSSDGEPSGDKLDVRTALKGYVRARRSLSASEQRVTAASGKLLQIMNSLPEGDVPLAD